MGGVRTVFVFLDVPKHVEFRAGDLPLMDVGTQVSFNMTLEDPQDRRRRWKIEGLYRVKKRLLKYENGRPSLSGMTQYIEWDLG